MIAGTSSAVIEGLLVATVTFAISFLLSMFPYIVWRSVRIDLEYPCFFRLLVLPSPATHAI